METKKPMLEKAVTELGGVVATAKKLGIHHSSVSRWLHTDLKIPLESAVKLEKLTKRKVKARDLRPDVYDD
jgi:DNA-binding transcriptional regulator YdaS (Cro superfamily)